MRGAGFDAARDGAAGWRLVSDQVMGGVSDGTLTLEEVAGRPALRLTGKVSLENDGGFLQMATDVAPAPGAAGIELEVLGDGSDYNLHLRTDAVEKPWQSFRATFRAGPQWRRIRLPFAGLEAHRIDAAFDPAGLRRIGLVAIGQAFRPDLSLSMLHFYTKN